MPENPMAFVKAPYPTFNKRVRLLYMQGESKFASQRNSYAPLLFEVPTPEILVG